jgi:CHAT domain-containing protein/Flp pilus assembly protein TadD
MITNLNFTMLEPVVRYSRSVSIFLVATQILLASVTPLRSQQADKPETPAQALKAFQAADKLFDEGKYDAAEREYIKLMDQLPKLFKPNSEQEHAVRSNLALLYSTTGRLAESRKEYRALLDMMHEKWGRTDPRSNPVIAKLARLIRENDDVDKAEEMLLEALKHCQAAKDQSYRYYVPIANELSLIYQQQGKFDRAEPLARQALQITIATKGIKNVDTLGIAHNLGGILYGLGNYPEAESILLDTRKIHLELDQSPLDIALCDYTLSDLFIVLGRYNDADFLLAEAITIYEKLFPQGSSDQVRALAAKGRLAQLQNDKILAEIYFEKATQMLEQLKESESQTAVDLESSFASFKMSIKEYQAAEQLLKHTIEVCQKLKNTFGLIKNKHNLAYCLMLQNRLDEAIKQQTEINREWIHLLPPNHSLTIVSQHNLARMYQGKADDANALKYFELARVNSFNHAVELLPSLPIPQQLDHIFLQDYPHLHRGLNLALSRPDDPMVIDKTIEWLANAKALPTKLRADSIARSQAINQQPTDRSNPKVADIDRQISKLALQLLELGNEPKLREQLNIELKTLQEEKRLLTRQEGKLAAQGVKERTWIETSQVVSSLEKSEALVDILRLGIYQPLEEKPLRYHYVAWVITPTKKRVIDLGDADTIDQLAIKVRKLISQGEQRIAAIGEVKAEEEVKKELSALSDKLIRPLHTAIDSAEQWIISPDGELWTIPWGALLIDEQRYLIEAKKLFLLNSSADMTQRNAVERSKLPTTPPVIYANPEFGELVQKENQGPSFSNGLRLGAVPQLAGASLEAESALKLFKKIYGDNVIAHTKSNATTENFLALKRPVALHIATHGFFEPSLGYTEMSNDQFQKGQLGVLANFSDPLLRCGLLGAKCNQINGNGVQGVITGLDVLSLDLRGCQMVILSACETGLGDNYVGEGVSGLRQAFHLAGARSVLASLWSISDNSTAILMDDFASKWSNDQSVADAFAEAQRSLIAKLRKANKSAHPYHWGAFAITQVP